jgi:hypothetical protein
VPMNRVTQGHYDLATLTLPDALNVVDRERILILPTGPFEADCVMCPPTLGPVGAAELLLRYVERRLRVRRRRIPLCRRCWTLEVVRVLAEDTTDIRVYVARSVAQITTDELAEAAA